MEYSVKLEKLSETVVFPDRLRERMSYDAARGQLSYRGFMTKCTYDELSKLDDHPEFRRALEQLFVLTSAEITPQPRARYYAAALVMAAGVVALVAAIAVWAVTRQSGQQPGNAVATTTSVSVAQ